MFVDSCTNRIVKILNICSSLYCLGNNMMKLCKEWDKLRFIFLDDVPLLKFNPLHSIIAYLLAIKMKILNQLRNTSSLEQEEVGEAIDRLRIEEDLCENRKAARQQ